LITFLQKSVNKNVGLAGEIKIYAFGSLIHSCSPNDIDLVIVFNHSRHHVFDILVYRQYLRQDCFAEFNLPADVCILTQQEIQNNLFLQEEGAILVYG